MFNKPTITLSEEDKKIVSYIFGHEPSEQLCLMCKDKEPVKDDLCDNCWGDVNC
jgi:hypothetical protein